MQTAEEAFRRLSIGDQALLKPAAADLDDWGLDSPRLDPRTEALIRVGALVASDASSSSYAAAVGAAIRAGASLDDLVATLLAVAGSVGMVRVVAAAPRVALAAGYDVDAGLEATGAG